MQKSYKHLPIEKREELRLIVRGLKKFPQIEMAILFGSHARGNWVRDAYQENYITYSYHSDFDILILVNKDVHSQRLAGFRARIKKKIKKITLIPTPISFFVHEIEDVNRQLKNAQYFFRDVYQEGILLFTRGNYTLVKPPHPDKLSIETRLKFAIENLEEWLESAQDFYDHFKFGMKRKGYRRAAFMLHQATESLYSATHLVYTHYRPKLHDIEELGDLVCGFDSAFSKVFPRSTKKGERLFKLLKQAYVRARYDKTYQITKKELGYLAGRVRKLRQLTKKSCQAQIRRFEAIRKKENLKKRKSSVKG